MTFVAPLLAELRPQMTLTERNVWLLRLIHWLRTGEATITSKRPSADTEIVQRVHALLDALDRSEDYARAFLQWWSRQMRELDGSSLLADFGFANRDSFLSELGERLRLKLLPASAQTTDGAQLFGLVMQEDKDAGWIALLDERTLARLSARLHLPARDEPVSRWRQELLLALQYCTSQLSAAGLSHELRRRMDETERRSASFQALATEVEVFCHLYRQPGADAAQVQAAALALKNRLGGCHSAMLSVFGHLDEHGVSVDLVFLLRQMRIRLQRLRLLIDALVQSPGSGAAVQLFLHLLQRGSDRRSVRALVSSSTSQLAAKMAERSAETGEHYITRTAQDYRIMLRKAAGGGIATAFTTWGKFALASVGLVGFWAGFVDGLLYAASFLLIQLMHWTLATKQPAATAPAMAAKLRDVKSDEAVEAFVDEVTHLIRSQVAAVLGNVGLVLPAVLAISAVLFWAQGQTMISTDQARIVLAKLHLLHPSTVLFAAFTGVLLFASSLVAGWAENSFVFYRIDAAIAHNPRIAESLGSQRALRLATFLRAHISGFAGNVSLGLMLGLVPVVLTFFGLAMEVRHVTLSMGQLAAACAALTTELGWRILAEASLWWCLLAIPMIGAANLLVSFFFAFQLASRAQVISDLDHQRIRRALTARIHSRWVDFLRPPHGGT